MPRFEYERNRFSYTHLKNIKGLTTKQSCNQRLRIYTIKEITKTNRVAILHIRTTKSTTKNKSTPYISGRGS